MPREELHIKDFSYGLIDEADPRDIPLGAGKICTSNDPNAYGILRGIRDSGTTFHATPNVSLSEWIVRDDGKRDLIYSDGSNIKSLLDFYGSPSAGATISGAGYSFTPQNKKVFIGMGTSTAPKVAIRKPAAKFNGIIARTVGTGSDDLVIDSSEYDGTAQIYYIKIFNATATGTFSSVTSLGGYGSVPYAVFNVSGGHGLNGDYNGKSVTITTGGGAGTYNGTYKFYFYSPTQFMLLSDIGQSVLFNVTDAGAWAVDGGSSVARWKWSTDDATYYPTSETLSTKEFAKVGSNGLKARFITESGKSLNDKWTVTFSTDTYTSGSLTVGTAYRISNYVTGDSFTNVGAPSNTTGVEFVATGTTPTTWTNSSTLKTDEILYIEDAECYNYVLNDSTDSFYIQIEPSGGEAKDDGFFTEQKKYFYGWSLIYDNSEESPIAYRSKGNNPTTFSTLAALQNVDIDFKITTTALPKRITGFNLWCAEANNNEAEKPETEFSYIQTFNLDGARVSTNTYTFKLKDVGNRGLTYENYTGIPEVLDSTSVKYTLSAVVNDKMFVGNCSRKGVENATNVIFRSKALRYGTFDWSKELLPISTKPTAMTSFRGKLIVFDESRMYIIEPEAFFVEQEFNVGCPYNTGFAVTEKALIWGDGNAAHTYDGIIPEDISTKRIRTTYQTYFAATNALKVVYDSEIKIVMFTVKNGTTIYALSYHVLNNRWDLLQLMTSVTSSNWGIFIGKGGESYLSNQTEIRETFGSSGGAWVWQSGDIDFGSPGEDKKFYFIRVDGNPSTVQFQIDGGTLTSVTGTEEIKIGGAWGKGKRITVKLTGSAAANVVYSFSIGHLKLGEM